MREASTQFTRIYLDTVRRYEAAGFSRMTPPPGSSLAIFDADLVMARGDEILVVEFKRTRPPWASDRLTQLADLAILEPVRVDVVTYRVPDPPALPEAAVIGERVDLAVRLFNEGHHQVGHVMLVAAFEGAAWRMAVTRGHDLPDEPWFTGLARLVREMNADGIVSDRRTGELIALADSRDRFVHGFEPRTPLLDDDRIQALAEYARAIASESYVTPAEIAEWLCSQLAQGADVADIDTGPLQLLETLRTQFPDAPNEDLSDAVELINDCVQLGHSPEE